MKHLYKRENNIRSIFTKSVIVSLCIYIGAFTTGDAIKNNIPSYKIVKKIPVKKGINSLLKSEGIDTNDDKVNLLLYAITQNQNIDEIERNLLFKLEPILEMDCIDSNTAYNNLLNLKIEYTKRPSDIDDSIKAIYTYSDNTVKVFENKKSFNKEILLHELVHVLFSDNKLNELPTFLIEGMTELLTNEYLANDHFQERNTYPFEIAMTKILCEMVGEEEVLKSYCEKNTSRIITKLSEYSSHLEGKIFISNINEVFKSFKNGDSIPKEKYNEMIEYMDQYIYNNYQQDTSKIETYNYYKGIINLIYKDNPYLRYNQYLYDNGVKIKVYYSKKLKDNYPNEYTYKQKKKSKKLEKATNKQ